MTTIGAQDLYGELDPQQRRRLYFLFVALNKSDPKAAIELAERMERFVTSRKFAAIGIAGDDADDAAADDAAPVDDAAPAEEEDASEPLAVASSSAGSAHTPAVNGNAQGGVARFGNGSAGAIAPSRLGTMARSDGLVRKSALDEAQRTEFKRAIASGANNDELATRFGLTRRQAHGLRIGFARAKVGGPAKRPEERRPLLNVAAEREQQESFLRQKQPPAPTMDDVVRFLRQIGDVVVRNGEHYMVNYSLSLTTQELVMRANRKRAMTGKPAFELGNAERAPAAICA
jgi:hypothetical protein